MPVITVITVVRNDLDALKKTRASLLNQTSTEFEHLVIDGASTDGTVDWLQEQENYSTNLRWVSEPDNGIYDAMNKGARMAEGGALIFLNAGDTYRGPDVLSRLRETLWTGTRWAYARALVVDENRNPIRPDYGLRTYSTLKHAYARAAINHQAVMMRKDFFFELGGFDIERKNVADYALLLKAGLASQPTVLLTIDVNYLDGGLSAINPHTQQEKHEARVAVLGYGPVRSGLDYGFSRAQDLIIRVRRLAKRKALAWGGASLVQKWAGRRA